MAAVRRTTPRSQLERATHFLVGSMADHLKTANKQGFQFWLGASRRPNQVQKTRLAQIKGWAQATAQNCKLPEMDQRRMHDLLKRLTLDKEKAEDGTLDDVNYARRWAACHAALRLLCSVTTSRIIPKPKTLDHLFFLTERASEAFFSVIRPEPLTPDLIPTAQHTILMAFKEIMD